MREVRCCEVTHFQFSLTSNLCFIMCKSKVNAAVALKATGRYNCAQAVACTYCDEAGCAHDRMYDTTNAFGVGMGNMEGTCGALVGAGVVLGLKLADRTASMKAMRRIMTRFAERNGTTVSHELKGVQSGCPRRACHDCVADAAEFLEEELGLASTGQ